MVILRRIVSEFGMQPAGLKRRGGYVEKEKRDVSSNLICLQPRELGKSILK